MPKPIDVFISYARKDEAALIELETHLALLQRQGFIQTWHDRQIEVGAAWEAEIRERLEAAQVILLLVSADFIASPSCWDVEMERAMARHAVGAARVIPILVRACDWKDSPFGGLSALPDNERPIQSWRDRDEAWTAVVRKLRVAMNKRALHGAIDKPKYPDAETRRLAGELERARARVKALEQAGEDTAGAQREVLEIRRRLREGGQLRAGDRLGRGGRYLLLERAGRGGFANVWRARDDERSQVVALKVLHTNLAEDVIRRERFFRGAQRMAAIDHPGIVRVLDPHAEDGGFHFFVMEFVSGGDLHRAVVEKQIAADQVVSLVLRVGGALREAHAKGLVHRDVKPANILLEPSGEPRLTDFDLVAAEDTTGGTRTGAALGTFLYSAPEAMAIDGASAPDARADVYGLGMTALFCIYGAQLPIEVVHDRQAFLRELPCDGAVKSVLEQAIAWKRERRFASVEDFCAALRSASLPRPAARSQRPVADPPVVPAAAPPPVAPGAAADAARAPATLAAPAAMAQPAAGRDPGATKIEMIAIPAGRFWMGSPASEASAKNDERPRRQVQVTPFSMSEHPVTQRLYREVMGVNPGQPVGDDLPVNHVSFWDAIEFCNCLSALHGLKPAYQLDWRARTWLSDANGYRLPTEAEWEFAARGTDSRIYPWGNEPPSAQLAWSGSALGRKGPSPVGYYPNGSSPFGLKDMAGNVYEWCWDWYGDYPATSGVSSNPIGPLAGAQRVLRGGSWQVSEPHRLRAAARYCLPPSAKDAAVGFRLARGAQPPQGAASLGQRSNAEPASAAPGGSRSSVSVVEARSVSSLPGARPGLHKLKFLEGIWQDPETGALACAREHRGKLRVVIQGNMTRGEVVDWRLITDALPAVELIGRFVPIQASTLGLTLGYTYLRMESTKRLVGGWWPVHAVPDRLISRLPNVKGMVPQTWVRQRSKHAFPAWVEDLFRKT